MAVLAHELPPGWLDAIRAAAPDVEIRTDTGCADDVVAVVRAWRAPERLDAFPNLRLIQCTSAGVDLVTMRDDVPPKVRIARVVDDTQVAGMSEYVLLHVLRQHRRLDDQQADFRRRQWRLGPPRRACDTRVGILGLGNLGRDAARKLSHVGFAVSGWSRTPKAIPDIACHTGADGLAAMLAGVQHLICLLPLTPDTIGLLNRAVFAAMPPGSFLINAGRGEHLVEADLLQALRDGQIAGATLDVMIREPVPSSHPFWLDDRILITPHSATSTRPEMAAIQIGESLRRIERGLEPLHCIDRALAY